MLIFPAIDIINGRTVRLTRGKYDSAKEYSATPLQAAAQFAADGATCLHVVDLDGAKSGNADNALTIEGIVKKYNMFVEVGGGIRTEEQIKKYLGCGIARVILGTVAVKNPRFVEDMINKYGDKISIGVDAKDNRVAVSGWEEVTSLNSVDFCKRLQDMGASHIIYTDISKDGCMQGTNLNIYQVLCQALSLKITASGGITYPEEIKKLKSMKVYAAVLGKAIYEGKMSLPQAIAAAED